MRRHRRSPYVRSMLSDTIDDTTIKRLRKKLGTTAPPLRTVRGVGYWRIRCGMLVMRTSRSGQCTRPSP